MKKPDDYGQNDNSNYITVGGHKCIFMQAREYISPKGNETLELAFDTTTEDTHPNYFKNKYNSDTRESKKWQGRIYVVPSTKFGKSLLEGLCTAVERSNQGFQCWDENGNLKTAELKGKRVGIVFRAEEYVKNDGTVGSSNKPFRFCTYDQAYDQEIPNKKTVSPSAGFMSVEADTFTGEGLPFA